MSNSQKGSYALKNKPMLKYPTTNQIQSAKQIFRQSEISLT